jgi:hypothetical protein
MAQGLDEHLRGVGDSLFSESRRIHFIIPFFQLHIGGPITLSYHMPDLGIASELWSQLLLRDLDHRLESNHG